MADLIRITVLLLGRVADVAGEPQLEYALVPPVRVGTLLDLIAVRRPQMAELLPTCRVTVNGENVDPAASLSDGDEVAIQPRD
jgi:molybdopterin converting factor small subunit